MKKNSIIAAFPILILFAGYYVFNNVFPAAKPLQYPPIENIISIKILTSDNKESKMLGTDFVRMSSYISNSKPTRIVGVSDSPAIRTYYKVEVLTETKMFRYYIYDKNNSMYMESPYEGIYLIDSKLLV